MRIFVAARIVFALSVLVAPSASLAQEMPLIWRGAYAGLHIGAGQTQLFNSSNTTNRTVGTGMVGGGQIGYNWQSGAAVYGFEVDASASTIGNKDISVSGFTSFVSEDKTDLLASLRFRYGIATGKALLYFTAGGAYGRFSGSFGVSDPFFGTFNGGYKLNMLGGVGGAGVEYQLTPTLIARGEVLYYYLAKDAMRAAEPIGRIGLNWKF